MPVVSIADAIGLRDRGLLDGRAVAVKGYWIWSQIPSCPAPGHLLSPLEEWCIDLAQEFSSIPYRGNVPPAGAATIDPKVLGETGGTQALWPYGGDGSRPDGISSVLILHADDPRAWQCPLETRDECRREFVVDRVAWAGGSDADLTLAETDVQPVLSIGDLKAIIGEASLLGAQPMLASDAPYTDPRLHLGGTDVVWIARSLREGRESGDATRAVNVWLVDDATASISSSIGLAGSEEYRPGRFRAQSAVRRGVIDHHITPFYRVEQPDGTVMQDLLVSGWQSSEKRVDQYLPGLPAMLDPGTYVVRAWRTTYDHRFDAEHPDECVAQFEIAALEDVRLEAAFPEEGACEWRAPTFEDAMF